jgi:hypothetical protein
VIPDPHLMDRLAKLLGMLGSTHGGERANAGALADKLVKEQGLTWRDILKARTSWRDPSDDAEAVRVALRYPHILTDWEKDFLRDVNGRSYFSAKQRAVIKRIIAKVRDHELCNA